MGFTVSIIGLYILGFISHYFYIWKHKRAKDKMWIVKYGVIVYLCLLLFDILVYVNALSFIVDLANKLSWIAADPYINGADATWNGARMVGIDSNITVTEDLNRFAILLWLCYLPVYLMGKMGSELLFGKRTYQQGALWALLPLPSNIPTNK